MSVVQLCSITNYLQKEEENRLQDIEDDIPRDEIYRDEVISMGNFLLYKKNET